MKKYFLLVFLGVLTFSCGSKDPEKSDTDKYLYNVVWESETEDKINHTVTKYTYSFTNDSYRDAIVTVSKRYVLSALLPEKQFMINLQYAGSWKKNGNETYSINFSHRSTLLSTANPYQMAQLSDSEKGWYSKFVSDYKLKFETDKLGELYYDVDGYPIPERPQKYTIQVLKITENRMIIYDSFIDDAITLTRRR